MKLRLLGNFILTYNNSLKVIQLSLMVNKMGNLKFVCQYSNSFIEISPIPMSKYNGKFGLEKLLFCNLR